MDSLWPFLCNQVEEKTKFDEIFDSLLPVNGLLSGDKVKPVLMNSKLPLDVLGRVSELGPLQVLPWPGHDAGSVRGSGWAWAMAAGSLGCAVPCSWSGRCSIRQWLVQEAPARSLSTRIAAAPWALHPRSGGHSALLLGCPHTSPPTTCLLLQVWDLSDIDKDGHLDRDEFAVVRPSATPASGEGMQTPQGEGRGFIPTKFHMQDYSRKSGQMISFFLEKNFKGLFGAHLVTGDVG